jgi:hypothetical protein
MPFSWPYEKTNILRMRFLDAVPLMHNIVDAGGCHAQCIGQSNGSQPRVNGAVNASFQIALVLTF